MAELINLAGTTSHSFTIGQDGVTTYHGKASPSLDIGKAGDIYIQDTTEIIVGGEDTGEFRPYGKVFMKLVVDGITKWEPIKNYSFDTPIIADEETEEKSNNYKISLQQAKSPSTASSSTKVTDYENNHDNFGVTRFGTDTEVKVSDNDKTTLYTNYQSYKADTDAHLPQVFTSTASYMPDKYIAVTPAQMADNIKTEMKRAIMVEGKLSELNDDYFGNADKADLVTALNHEASSRDTKDLDLQAQIDAITSKSDVVDVVQYYNKDDPSIDPPPAAGASDIVHYDTSQLGDDDVVKVLTDESHNDAVSYYRYNRVPSTYDVLVASKTDLNSYDTSLLHADDIAIVTHDESAPSPYTNKATYYKLSVNGTTKTWVYQGPEEESWTYVGSVDAYYTKAESDARFVNATENVAEDVTGTKTFLSTIIRKGALSGSDLIVTQANDTNNKGSIETDALYTSSKVYNRMKVTNSTATKNGYVDLQVSDTGVGTLTLGGTVSSWSNNTASNSTSSNDVALVGWVNDPAKSTNVVHRTGDETITGTKTMTGATVLVATQTRGDSSTKAASTAFVADGLSLKVNIANMPAISDGTAGQVIACPASGDSYVWKTVRDITTLEGLDDTTINTSALVDDQSLVYDGTSGKWVNRRPAVATISYW